MPEIEDLGTFDDSEIDLGEEIEVKEPECEFVCGSAGTGKTFWAKQKIQEDPTWAILGSTTGISAVNLGTRTIHSILGYFNTSTLEDNFRMGYLQARLRKLAMEDQFRNIVIDEISMMGGRQLDVIYNAVKEVNAYQSMRAEGRSLGLILVGDFAQLPVIEDKNENLREGFAFEAQSWPQFEKNTRRLTKMWRQDNPKFLEALNLLRAGKGKDAADILQTLTRFQVNVDPRFEGTTILSTNKEVERANALRMIQVKGRPLVVSSKRWGKPSNEWKIIPDQLQLKIGALVMLLNNDSPAFSYCNGDLGHIVDYTAEDSGKQPSFQVELLRNQRIVNIRKIHRTTTTKDEPDMVKSGQVKPEDIPTCHPPTEPPLFGQISLDGERGIYHIGGIEYFPLRVGYAATTWKTQGLSLDRAQVDYRGAHFGSPACLYVALSRCRTPEGLRLVGLPQIFAKRCNVDPRVLPWL